MGSLKGLFVVVLWDSHCVSDSERSNYKRSVPTNTSETNRHYAAFVKHVLLIETTESNFFTPSAPAAVGVVLQHRSPLWSSQGASQLPCLRRLVRP